jgi:hypothetical protein
MEIATLIHQLLTLPKTAVFALINDFNKRVYVAYSTKFKTRLMTIIELIATKRWKHRGMINELKHIRLVILEKNIPEHELKLFTKYHRDNYRNQGYRFYNKEKIPLQYSFAIRLTTGGRIAVVAFNSRKEPTILGLFYLLEEANKFLVDLKDRNLNPSQNLVYARNILTKDYIRKQNSQPLELYVR